MIRLPTSTTENIKVKKRFFLISIPRIVRRFTERGQEAIFDSGDVEPCSLSIRLYCSLTEPLKIFADEP